MQYVPYSMELEILASIAIKSQNIIHSIMPKFRYHRYLFVGIRYFSVIIIPMSVSVTVFLNTAVSVLLYRLGTTIEYIRRP